MKKTILIIATLLFFNTSFSQKNKHEIEGLTIDNLKNWIINKKEQVIINRESPSLIISWSAFTINNESVSIENEIVNHISKIKDGCYNKKFT